MMNLQNAVCACHEGGRQNIIVRVKIVRLLLIATSLGLVLSCKKDERSLGLDRQLMLDLDKAAFEDLKKEGAWMIHPDFNVLIVNVNDEFRAFSSVCPYRQCTRDWEYRPGVFTCTYFDSKYDATGQYLSGPSLANLKRFIVSQDKNILTIN